MIYLDTSFLTPLFREEPASEYIEGFLASVPAGTLPISQWTRVEFASVIARDVRMKTLDVVSAHKLIEAFDSLADDSLHVLVATASDFDLAHDFVAEFAAQLRGPDALHIAIAHNHGIQTSVRDNEAGKVALTC